MVVCVFVFQCVCLYLRVLLELTFPKLCFLHMPHRPPRLFKQRCCKRRKEVEKKRKGKVVHDRDSESEPEQVNACTFCGLFYCGSLCFHFCSLSVCLLSVCLLLLVCLFVCLSVCLLLFGRRGGPAHPPRSSFINLLLLLLLFFFSSSSP